MITEILWEREISNLSAGELHCSPRTKPAAERLRSQHPARSTAEHIAFEGFDECLRDAVGFWRADWRETKLEAEGRCGVERVLGDVRRAVVGLPLGEYFFSCS